MNIDPQVSFWLGVITGMFITLFVGMIVANNERRKLEERQAWWKA